MEAQLPTPYDIINPTTPPLAVPPLAWILLLVLTAIGWIALFMLQRKKKQLKKSEPLPPIVVELSELVAEFEEKYEKKHLHLFVRLAKRHIESSESKPLEEAAKPFLSELETSRFAPQTGPNVTKDMKELVSLFSRSFPSDSKALEAQHV